MKNNNLKDRAALGFVWSIGERFGNLISEFVISIFLARLLSPKEFGLIAMVVVFNALLSPFIDAGLGKALIRKQDVTDEDYSTVFWWNITLSIVVYGILYLCAPLVSAFYKEPLLTEILRVLGLTLIIQSFSTVQTNRLIKTLNFRSLTIRSLISNITSGLFGLYLAFSGWSYWALVARTLSNAIISAVLLWSISGWAPSFKFSIKTFKELFGFGSKLLLSSLLDTGFNNIYPLVIGKYFSAVTLGFYNRAKAFKDMPQSLVTQITSRVTYPIFSELQNSGKDLKAGYSRLAQLISFIYFPILMGLMGLSKGVVLVLLTEKWISIVPMMKALTIVGLLYPIHSLNLNVLTVKGRSDLFLYLEIFKKAMTLVILFISYRWGIMGLIYGQIVHSWVSFFINTYYTEKFINYGVFQQLKDIMPNILTSLIMGLVVLWGSEQLGIYTWWSLGFWGLVGVFIYITFTYFLNPRDILYMYDLIVKKFKLRRILAKKLN